MDKKLNLSKWIEHQLGENTDIKKINLILRALSKILSSTGHLPTVHSIARGIGYCYYYARLSEIIGVRGYRESVSGKGSDIHKVVGLALLDYVNDGMPEPIERMLEEYVNTAFDNLQPLLRVGDDSVRNLALRLLERLFLDVLPKAVSKLKIDENKLFPVVEQQFIDYNLHVRGSPDAILEDKKSRKAIVIEWKTSGDTPWNYEKVQVLIYALLEAVRLGYDIPDEAIDAILGKLREKDGYLVVENFKILPVIIRPTGHGELYPHPALAPPEKIKDRYKEIKDFLYKIPIMAEHLTVLLTDIRRLTGYELDEFKIPHPAKKDIKANALTLMPISDKLYRGVPKEQNKYPCVSKNGKPICNLIKPCKFYYGRDIYEWDDYEKILWGIRFDVLNEKEKNLLTYKALYHLFKEKSKEEIIDKLRKGYGFRFKIPEEIFIGNKFEGKKATKKLIAEREVYNTSRYEGLTSSKETIEKRLDVLDYVEFVDGRIEGYRKLENYEDEIAYVIGEGKPVLLSTLDADSPLLSINVFARVDEVNIENSEIHYIFSAPSKVLEYQMLLFGRYLDSYEHLRKDILIAEIDVDLTRLDLEAIDALQRHLKDQRVSSIEDTEKKMITEITEEEIMKSDDFETIGSILKRLLEALRR